jgi:hypothetical protein
LEETAMIEDVQGTTTAPVKPDDDERSSRLRAKITALVWPSTPMTEEILDGLLKDALATNDADLCADLIMTVHGRGALKHARKMAEACSAHLPHSEELQKILRLTQPTRVAASPPREKIDRRPDYKWLRQHAREYPGEWLVLCYGKLWGHAVSLAEAEAQARGAGLTSRPFLYRVLAEDWRGDAF